MTNHEFTAYQTTDNVGAATAEAQTLGSHCVRTVANRAPL